MSWEFSAGVATGTGVEEAVLGAGGGVAFGRAASRSVNSSLAR